MSATDGPESNVIQLHIYDLSRGLAAQLSPSLLGKPEYIFVHGVHISFPVFQENRLMGYGKNNFLTLLHTTILDSPELSAVCIC